MDMKRRRMRKDRILAAMVIAAVTVLACTGCGKENEETGSEGAAGLGTGIADRVQAPEHVEGYFESESGRTKITVDADVFVPAGNRFPIVEAIPRVYTEEELRQLLGIFVLEDEEWFDYSYIYIEEDQRDNEVKAFTADTKRTKTYSYDGLIEYWEMRGSMAESYAPEVLARYDPDSFKSFSYSHWQMADTGAVCYGPEIEYGCGPFGDDVWNSGVFEPLSDGMAADCTITLKEAKSLADELVHTLWPDYEVNVYGQPPERKIAASMTEEHDLPRYYCFNYTKTVEGLPVTWTYQSSHSSGSKYDFVPSQSSIGVTVSDKGVRAFLSNTPWDTGKILQEDAELLPFEEIYDIFGHLGILAQSSLENNNPDLEGYELYVHEITLGYMAVKTSDGYEYTPVWDFFASRIFRGTGGYGAFNGIEQATELRNYVALTINAVNGTVIDRSDGY